MDLPHGRDWLDEEPHLPWSKDDLDWILRRDPRLAPLRSEE